MTGVLLILVLGGVMLWMRLTKNISPTWVVYKIKKNKHNPPFTIKTYAPIKNSLMFSIIFTEGCDYDTSSLESDALDINKAYGISYGFDPHWNSIRVGWRWNRTKKMIEVFWYVYSAGKRTYKHITDVALFEQVDFSITRQGNIVYLRGNVEDKAFHYIFRISDSWIRFKMFPYFGGNKKAPCDMKIVISDR